MVLAFPVLGREEAWAGSTGSPDLTQLVAMSRLAKEGKKEDWTPLPLPVATH